MPAPRRTTPRLPDICFSGRLPFGTAREHREALSLVRQLAASAGIGIAELPLRKAILQPISGGRSAARVFRLTPFFGPGGRTEGPPFVVKIAPRAQGLAERANYERCVRWGLPPACRPELLAFGVTGASSGLCFSFAGGLRSDTLSACLQRGEAARLDLVLSGIFAPMRQTWYSPALLRDESDLARRYLTRYFTGRGTPAEAEATLLTCAERYFKARQQNGRCVIGRLSFPSPRALLFGSGRKRPYRSCILHGDLNSDNILLGADAAGGTGVALVDFQKTGRGHVYEDLVHVEASVRINHPRDAAFAEILDKERLIALGRRLPRNDSYRASIQAIRSAASRFFDCAEGASDYHFAVAAIGLRLMQAVDLSHAARARITASVLWAAKMLEDV